MVARRTTALEQVAERLGPDHVQAVTADVRDGGALEAAVQAGVARFGPITAVMANAGRGHDGALLECSPEDLQDIFDVDVSGVHRLVLACRPHLGPGAHVVIVASVVSRLPIPLMGAYVAAKHAVAGYAACLRMELQAEGVLVTSVHPGTVATPFFDVASVSGSAWTWRPGGALAPETVARRMLRTVGRRRRMLVLPFSSRALWWLHGMTPGLVEWVLRRALQRQRRAAASDGGTKS